MGLETTTQEMLALFPRQLPDLDVALYPNPNSVLCVYFQKKTHDLNRNWLAYQKWLKKKKRLNNQCRVKEAMDLPLPADFDSIYDQCSSLVKKSHINPDDKIILEAHIMDQKKEGIGSVYLSHLERNRDPQ